MRAVFRLLIIGWLVHSACATSLAAASSLAEPAPLTLSIGISAETANNLPEDLLEKTISSISADLPETSIKIITLSERELHQKISGREVELFISSAEFFRQNKMQGVRDIAALISKQAPDPNHVDGSVILVDTQRVGLQHLEQLNGKTLLVNPAFGSSYLHYLFGEDESPKIGRIVEKRTSIPQLIDALLLGQADALVLPACKLEELAEISALNTSRLRVLDSKSVSTAALLQLHVAIPRNHNRHNTRCAERNYSPHYLCSACNDADLKRTALERSFKLQPY